MTEQQAYELYRRHISECGGCRPSHGVLCESGKLLWNGWQAAEKREAPTPHRHAPRAGRGR